MAQQRYIIRLEDKEGKMVDFERWSFKKVETCIQHMVELYSTYSNMYMPKLDKADRVVAYPTPDGCHEEAPVWSVTVDEFRAMVKKREEEKQ